MCFRRSGDGFKVHRLTWILLAVFVACQSPEAAAPSDGVHAVMPVVLVAGQSNALGFDAPGSAHVAEPGDAGVLLWIQGESDSSEDGSKLYASAMEPFLAALRSDLTAPHMRAVLALNTKFGGGSNEWVGSVAAAQQEVATRDPHCAYVDTSAATIANNAHYDAAGTLLVGRLMGEAHAGTPFPDTHRCDRRLRQRRQSDRPWR